LTIGVTVSIGLADIDAYATVPDLLAAADAALYRAKTEGRNCLRLAA
jgi:PleD family two-component response regulator